MEHTISDESFQKLKEKKQGECPFAETCTMIAIRKKKDGLNSSNYYHTSGAIDFGPTWPEVVEGGMSCWRIL